MTKPAKILTRSVKLYLTLLILATGLIIYGTLFPEDHNLPDIVFLNDKFVHLLMFLVWTFFYGIVRFLKKNYALLPIFITGSIFGLSIEVLQYFLPTNRHAELLDFGADVLGTSIAILLLYLLLKKVPDFKN